MCLLVIIYLLGRRGVGQEMELVPFTHMVLPMLHAGAAGRSNSAAGRNKGYTAKVARVLAVNNNENIPAAPYTYPNEAAPMVNNGPELFQIIYRDNNNRWPKEWRFTLCNWMNFISPYEPEKRQAYKFLPLHS